MLGFKLLLWLARRPGEARPFAPLALLRPLAGIAAPAAILLAGASPRAAAVLALVAAGELLDRADFYRSLRLPSPRRELDRALAAIQR